MNRISSVVIGLLLLLGAIAMMAPFGVMIATSLLSMSQLQAGNDFSALWRLIQTEGLHWDNYARLFQQIPIGLYLWNSIVIAVVTTVGHVVLSAMAAYAFSRMRFAGRNLLFFFFLLTLMVPPQVNIVPLFFLMKQFGWMDSYWALIVPGLFGAFGVFMLRQWFNALPKELEDAARLDGCNPWQTFWQIAMPLAGPALAALSIFVFINTWNSFMWPLIVTYSDSIRTLPVGIAALKGSFRDVVDWPLLMAASTVSVLPVVIVFLIGQKPLLKGMLMGGGKE